MRDILLDTCAVIWIGQGAPIASGSEALLDECHQAGRTTFVSPFSAWEIGMLISRDRLRLSQKPATWLRSFLARGGACLAPVSPEILIESSFLPATPPRDPMDRIVIATARADNLTVVTRDRAILDYALQGHVNAIEC